MIGGHRFVENTVFQHLESMAGTQEYEVDFSFGIVGRTAAVLPSDSIRSVWLLLSL